MGSSIMYHTFYYQLYKKVPFLELGFVPTKKLLIVCNKSQAKHIILLLLSKTVILKKVRQIISEQRQDEVFKAFSSSVHLCLERESYYNV